MRPVRRNDQDGKAQRYSCQVDSQEFGLDARPRRCSRPDISHPEYVPTRCRPVTLCNPCISDDNSMPPGLQPAHKMSIILFLERVYGIPDQETFFRLIEEAFLPDIRAATILDMVRSSPFDSQRSNASLPSRPPSLKVTWPWL